MLALAHHIQAAIDRGLVPDRSTVARQFGLTTARLTQVLDLLANFAVLIAPINSRVVMTNICRVGGEIAFLDLSDRALSGRHCDIDTSP